MEQEALEKPILKKTALFDLHRELGAKMVPFAGYEMPVQYPMGVMKEHLHCRADAGLFDVSHMGQVVLRGPDFETTARALEKLVPVDVLGLGINRQRYAIFTNEEGGILDDLMVANRDDHLFLVVNAACKDADIAHMRKHLEPHITVKELTNRSLVALQGPSAEAVLARLCPQTAQMRFMDVGTFTISGAECWVSRSGYTGEDGFEISIPTAAAETVTRALLADAQVAPIGLGARDSLRLEAGLCLYGNDIDTRTNPVEASLSWAIQKARRAGGARAGGFLGEAALLDAFANTPTRRRVGLSPEGRAPLREGVALFADAAGQNEIGRITSGGFGPSIGAPVAMGYVQRDLAKEDSTIFAALRGKYVPVRISKLPFIGPNFKR